MRLSGVEEPGIGGVPQSSTGGPSSPRPSLGCVPPTIHLYLKRAVRSNKVVGRSSEEEPPLESLCALPDMLGPTGQCWEPGPEGGIEPLDERSVDRTPLALGHLDQTKRLEQITEGQSALDPLAVCPLDHLDDMQVSPLDELDARSERCFGRTGGFTPSRWRTRRMGG